MRSSCRADGAEGGALTRKARALWDEAVALRVGPASARIGWPDALQTPTVWTCGAAGGRISRLRIPESKYLGSCLWIQEFHPSRTKGPLESSPLEVEIPSLWIDCRAPSPFSPGSAGSPTGRSGTADAGPRTQGPTKNPMHRADHQGEPLV